MDYKKLLDAAGTGNVEQLQITLAENPLILTEFSLAHESEDTLLHVATKAGHLNFVSQILKHKPELARESNNQGYRPLDIAAGIGSVEIVREFLKNDHELCRLKGRGGRSALHFAAASGRIGVIDELVSACSECIMDVTVLRETALHLAVKNNKYEALSGLVKWVERLGMEEIINWGDLDGNTVLHLATCRKQIESIQLLFGTSSNGFSGVIEVNARNSKDLTAMDILDILIENPIDLQLREILRCNGALGALQGSNAMPSSFQELNNNNKSAKSPISKPPSKFHLQRYSSPSDERNALLVVAAFFALITFQAGVCPPLGLLDPHQLNATSVADTTTPSPSSSPPMTDLFRPLLGYNLKTGIFIVGNTLGLGASVSIIIYLTGLFPFQMELLTSLVGVMTTYAISIMSVIENHAFPSFHFLLFIALFLPLFFRLFLLWGHIAWKWWKTPSTTTPSATN